MQGLIHVFISVNAFFCEHFALLCRALQLLQAPRHLAHATVASVLSPEDIVRRCCCCRSITVNSYFTVNVAGGHNSMSRFVSPTWNTCSWYTFSKALSWQTQPTLLTSIALSRQTQPNLLTSQLSLISKKCCSAYIIGLTFSQNPYLENCSIQNSSQHPRILCTFIHADSWMLSPTWQQLFHSSQVVLFQYNHVLLALHCWSWVPTDRWNPGCECKVSKKLWYSCRGQRSTLNSQRPLSTQCFEILA